MVVEGYQTLVEQDNTDEVELFQTRTIRNAHQPH